MAGRGRRVLRRVLVGVAGLAVAGAAWWALGAPGLLDAVGVVAGVEPPPARFALPAPTGPFPVGTVELHLVDRDRPDPWGGDGPRELMVSLWYPARANPGGSVAPYMRPGAAAHFEEATLGSVGLDPAEVDLEGVRTHAYEGAPVADGPPRPVLVYSPGGGLPRTVGTTVVEDLASHGYVVVTVDHTHEAGEVEFPGGRVELAAPTQDAELEELIAVRVDDVRAVLDRLEEVRGGGGPDAAGRALPPGLAGALDLDAIGALGHSAGGFTAAEAMLDDARIDAGANLDGSMGYDIDAGEFGDAVERGLDRPFLLLGAGASGSERRPHTHRHAPDWAAFWAASTGPRHDLHLPEGEHFSFADHQVALPQLDAKRGVPAWLQVGMIGTVDPGRAVAAQREVLAAFFDRYLRGGDGALLDGPSPDHPDLDVIG